MFLECDRQDILLQQQRCRAWSTKADITRRGVHILLQEHGVSETNLNID